MILSEELKSLVREGKKKKKWHYTEEEYFSATELILLYLKEFRNVTSYDEFNAETFRLWYFNKPFRDGDLIFNDLKQGTNLMTTETGRFFFSHACCNHVNLVASAASIMQNNEKMWNIVAPYFVNS